MAYDIDQAFVKQFEGEVHEAYQRRGSKLRGTVRTKNGIVGMSTTFQKVGTGTAVRKGRHAEIPAMNIDHEPVECILHDWYAGDWVDKLDELKVQHDERAVVANAGAYALGRKTDELIITAMDAVAGSAVNATAMDAAYFASWVGALGAKDVPVEYGQVFGVVSWKVWERMLAIPQFASSDYIGDALPYAGGAFQSRPWLDVIWMPHTGLSGGAGARKCHLYHTQAVGHAIGAEVETDITWHGDRAAHFINNMMSQGAVLIDTIGLETRNVNEGA